MAGDDPQAILEAVLRQQEAILRRLDDLLEAVQQRPASDRDRQYGRLLAAISREAADETFSAGEMFRRAQAVEGELLRSFIACDITSAQRFGKRLEHLADKWINGRRIVRVGTDDRGAIWAMEIKDDDDASS